MWLNQRFESAKILNFRYEAGHRVALRRISILSLLRDAMAKKIATRCTSNHYDECRAFATFSESRNYLVEVAELYSRIHYEVVGLECSAKLYDDK